MPVSIIWNIQNIGLNSGTCSPTGKWSERQSGIEGAERLLVVRYTFVGKTKRKGIL